MDMFHEGGTISWTFSEFFIWSIMLQGEPVGFSRVFMQRENIFSSTVGAVQSAPPFLLTAVKGSLLHVVGSFDWLDLYKAMSDEAMINS